MNISALPQEVIDAVIDHLYCNTSSLAACSLVRRSWRDAAQHHLFATLCCRGDAIGDLLQQLVTSQTFAARVRTIRLLGATHGPTESLEMGTLAELLEALPNLRVLYLIRISLDADAHAEPGHPLGSRGRPRVLPKHKYKLRHLDLVAVYQATAQRLLDMLSLFAEVEKLTLRCVFTDMTADRESGHVETMQSVGGTRCTKLVVDGRYPISFEVRRGLCFDSLETLEIKFPRPPNIASVLEIMAAGAQNLQSLTLHLHSMDFASEWKELQRFPWSSLRHLNLIVEAQSGSHPLYFGPVPSILSSFPDTLTHITLTLDESWWTIKNPEDLGWLDLQAELMRFTCLKHVTIRLIPPKADGSLLPVAVQEMPMLAARGLLL